MSKGNINVSVENIFPLIKSSCILIMKSSKRIDFKCYDATTKLKHLIAIGEAKVEYGSPQIEIKVDRQSKDSHYRSRIGNDCR